LLIAIHKRESRDTHNTSSNTWDWISLIKEVNLVKPEFLSRGLRAHKDLTQAYKAKETKDTRHELANASYVSNRLLYKNVMCLPQRKLRHWIKHREGG